jgi:hypothetical protein
VWADPGHRELGLSQGWNGRGSWRGCKAEVTCWKFPFVNRPLPVLLPDLMPLLLLRGLLLLRPGADPPSCASSTSRSSCCHPAGRVFRSTAPGPPTCCRVAFMPPLLCLLDPPLPSSPLLPLPMLFVDVMLRRCLLLPPTAAPLPPSPASSCCPPTGRV